MCWCGFRRQVPEGSGRFRRFPTCAGVGSRGRFQKVPEGWFRKVSEGSGVCWRQVPEGSGEFRCVQVWVPEAGSGRFRKISKVSDVCWCRFWRQVPEGSGEFWCVLV